MAGSFDDFEDAPPSARAARLIQLAVNAPGNVRQPEPSSVAPEEGQPDSSWRPYRPDFTSRDDNSFRPEMPELRNDARPDRQPGYPHPTHDGRDPGAVQKIADVRRLPADSDGGYSIDPETGHLVIHIGGRKLKPVDQLGDVPLRTISPELDRRMQPSPSESGARVPGPVESGQELPVSPGTEGGPQYPADFLEHPGRHALGIARTLPMTMGMTGGPAGAVSGPIMDAAAPIMSAAKTLLTASPKTTAGVAAGTALAAGSGEAGDDPRAEVAVKQAADDRASMDDAAKQLQSALEQRKSLDKQQQTLRDQAVKFSRVPEQGEAVKRAQEELNALGYNVGNVDGLNRGKTRAALQQFAEDKKKELAAVGRQIESIDSSVLDLRRRSSPEYAAYVGKVREAEAARQEILDKSRKPFEEEYQTAAKNWWMIPLIAGGLTALALRIPMQISERLQASRWWGAVKQANNAKLTPAQRAEARLRAEKFEADIPKKDVAEIASKYAKIGAGEGAGVANVPEFHDLFLPADNPKRKAYEAYIERLPADHPEIARTVELLKSIPEDNPARRAALQHFGYIYPFIVKAVEGGLEGAFTASGAATLAKGMGPFESGLPRPETKSLLEAAADRAAKAVPKAQRPGTPPPPPPPVETWRTPSGEVIKRGKSGGTWHDEKGGFTGPPPKGSKRLSMLDPDNIAYLGGFA